MYKLSIQLELSRKSTFEIYRRAFQNSVCDNATREGCLLISDISNAFEMMASLHHAKHHIWSNIGVF